MSKSVILICTSILLMISCGVLFYTGSASLQAEPLTHGRKVILGISPFFPDDYKKIVREGILRLMLEEMRHGDSLVAYDAYSINLITQFSIPPKEVYDNTKVRVRLLKKNLRDINNHFDRSFDLPNNKTDFIGAVRTPQFLSFISATVSRDSNVKSVLILGSPLYVDEREPSFSMLDSYPSDSHLLASQDVSVFGTANKKDFLKDIRVHHAYFGNPWINDKHAYRVERFWRLFVHRQGGALASFLADLPTMIPRVLDFDLVMPPVGEEIDPKEKIIAMKDPKRVIPKWVHERGSNSSPPPTHTVGKLEIAIVWECVECDMDLYSKPTGAAEELFYNRVRTREGEHLKDFLTPPNPKNGLEYIEYNRPVDLREVTAAINFYNGNSPGGARGRVKVSFNRKIYEETFWIKSSRGNQGRESKIRAQSDYWVTLNIPKIVGLKQ